MRKLSVFDNVTLDGYFTSENGDIEWAHEGADAEWNEFVSNNASGEGALLFGRVTFEMMRSFWTTPAAMEAMPAVAEGMNRMPKYVASRTLHDPGWSNTRVLRDLVPDVGRLKEESGVDLVILGSGSIVAQLAREGLIDEYQFVVNPVALGGGRTMFDSRVNLKLARSRTFGNGKVVLWYVPA